MSVLFSCGTVDGATGPARNPWKYKFGDGAGDDEEPVDWHITGGSSGGSAAAVATGVVYAYVYNTI